MLIVNCSLLIRGASLFLMFGLISFSGISQVVPMNPDPQNHEIITDREPIYPKGEKALFAFVQDHIRFTDEAIKRNIIGEVTLSFDVNADSTLTNILVLEGIGWGIDEEVKRIISEIKFLPALQMGVAVKMNMMLTFPVKAH